MSRMKSRALELLKLVTLLHLVGRHGWNMEADSLTVDPTKMMDEPSGMMGRSLSAEVSGQKVSAGGEPSKHHHGLFPARAFNAEIQRGSS